MRTEVHVHKAIGEGDEMELKHHTINDASVHSFNKCLRHYSSDEYRAVSKTEVSVFSKLTY